MPIKKWPIHHFMWILHRVFFIWDYRRKWFPYHEGLQFFDLDRDVYYRNLLSSWKCQAVYGKLCGVANSSESHFSISATMKAFAIRMIMFCQPVFYCLLHYQLLLEPYFLLLADHYPSNWIDKINLWTLANKNKFPWSYLQSHHCSYWVSHWQLHR